MNYVIAPVLKELGYAAPLRADQIGEPGMITHQIIRHVTEDSLVIADLTGENPNVYYELAIRHMIKKPLVQIVEVGNRLPFDVSTTRTIFISHTDLQNVEDAKKELKVQIRAAEKEPGALENPISVAVELAALTSSRNPQERIFGETRQELAEIKRQIVDLRIQIDHYASLKHVEKINKAVQDIKASIDTMESNVGAGNFHTIDDVMDKVDEVKDLLEKK